jgi:hypothetical protein
MDLGFKVGDTVDVAFSNATIQGEVTRISSKTEDETECGVVEIRRAGGSHVEIQAVDGTFDHITKAV